jgi:hypothetical protein
MPENNTIVQNIVVTGLKSNVSLISISGLWYGARYAFIMDVCLRGGNAFHACYWA